MDATNEPFRFQVNLRAIIELLSSHLYSGPEVFIRELIQNGVDAIRARIAIDHMLDGKVEIELIRDAEGRFTLAMSDNGIGLLENEVHEFLATVGNSSKREDMLVDRSDYIGQFGIGLLSCFIVSEEIVLLTRSAKAGTDARAVEWRGFADGRYTTRLTSTEMEPGTRVFLRPKPGQEAHFHPEQILKNARHYAGLLPIPVDIITGTQRTRINQAPPWLRPFRSRHSEAEEYRAFGRELFETEFFDAIPLDDPTGAFQGVAFVLAHSPGLAARKLHRVYVKDMLLTDRADNLLPEWAFFVKCVINSRNLRPTASRESLCEDRELTRTRDVIGNRLRAYILDLAKNDRKRLDRFIASHSRAIKSLAVEDDEFLELIIDFLPFETSLGEMTLPECRRASQEVGYISNLDEFRQIAEIAAAQRLCVINAAYTFETELLQRVAAQRPGESLAQVKVDDILSRLDESSVEDRERFFELVQVADRILQRFRCRAEVRRFQPSTHPVVHMASQEALFRRGVEQARAASDELWSSLLDSALLRSGPHSGYSELCFNAGNPLVARLAAMARAGQTEKLRPVLEVLYVQALLLARRSPMPAEMELMNGGILWMVENLADSRP